MSLTGAQRASLWTADGEPCRGLRIVSARAGTGKTSTLARYVADLLSTWDSRYRPWQGIAMLSYTNVARLELEEKLGGGAGLMASYPHFVGTIDSFLNQFIFLPHGARVMDAHRRPRLVGEPHTPWQPKREIDRYFESVGYGLDAEIRIDPGALAWEYKRNKEWIAAQSKAIQSSKRSLNRRRYATQADANFFAYKVLSQDLRLARALVGRFPVLIVDESQDMTEVQHAILDDLVAAGLSHAVLIGDEWQAIYEWNTAKPDLFVAKLRGERWQAADIAGSFRCSPRICDALNSLAGDGSLRPVPGAKNEGYDEPVRVEAFNANALDARQQLRSIIDGVAERLAGRKPHAEGAAHIEVAVLARGKEEASHLRSLYLGEASGGRPSSPVFQDKRTKTWLALVYHAAAGNVASAFSAYERLLDANGDYRDRDAMRRLLTEEWFGPGGTVLDYRKRVIEAIAQVRGCYAAAEAAILTISSSASACNDTLPGIGTMMADLRSEVAKYNPAPSKGRRVQPPDDVPLSLLFGHEETSAAVFHPSNGSVKLTFSTIHGVKGETYDGVVLALRKQTTSCGCASSARSWLKIASHDILKCESKRLQYVAASRAAQLLVVAAEDDVEAWRRIFRCDAVQPEAATVDAGGDSVDAGLLSPQLHPFAHPS